MTRRARLVVDEFLAPYLSLIHEAPTLVLVWIGVLGACIGSFLNVVVYRLPTGQSLVHPGSHCPACGHDIRWYDNLPMLGWLRLRGRCRDCGKQISIRYPLVEATVTGLFLYHWCRDIGWPQASPASLANDILLFCQHVAGASVLLAVVLIDCDRRSIPYSLLMAGGVVPLIVGVAQSQSLLRLAAGAVACAITAGATHLLPRMRHATPTLPVQWAAFGVVCGLNAAPSLVLLAMLVTTACWWLVARRVTFPHAIWTSMVAVATWLSIAAQ